MIQTNWIVFTGAASSGKTTIIQELASIGYDVKEELMRQYLFEKYGDNVPVNSIPWTSPAFQSMLLTMKIKRELLIDPKRIILFDRGVPDVYAYASTHGISINEVYQEHPYRYRAVLLFESLPVVRDDIRRETNDDALLQEKALEEVYGNMMAYPFIRVPKFSNEKDESITKRLAFIKSQIENIIK